MAPAAAVRALVLLLGLGAAGVTLRANALNQSLAPPITKGELEALIAAGEGTVVQPPKAFIRSWADVVMFKVPGCERPLYVRPGSLNNNLFYYLRANQQLDQSAYDTAMAYREHMGPPLNDFALRYHSMMSDISYFFGQPPQPNAGQALFFLVPHGCSAQGNIDWQSLWRGSASAAVLTQP